jgi:hypothetical protein
MLHTGVTYNSVLYAEATYAGGAAAPPAPAGASTYIIAYPPEVAGQRCCTIEIDEGAVVTLPASIYRGDALVDPVELVVLTRSPAGAVQRYEYGADAAISRADAGHYSFDLLVDDGGDWTIRWQADGGVREISFPVAESVFV